MNGSPGESSRCPSRSTGRTTRSTVTASASSLRNTGSSAVSPASYSSRLQTTPGPDATSPRPSAVKTPRNRFGPCGHSLSFMASTRPKSASRGLVAMTATIRCQKPCVINGADISIMKVTHSSSARFNRRVRPST